MAEDASFKIVDESTIQNALNRNFNRLFNSLCEANDLSRTSDALIHLPRTGKERPKFYYKLHTDIRNLTLQLFLGLEHCGLRVNALI